MRADYPVTAQSIAAAKAARDAERRELERKIGNIRVTEGGHVVYYIPLYDREG